MNFEDVQGVLGLGELEDVQGVEEALIPRLTTKDKALPNIRKRRKCVACALDGMLSIWCDLSPRPRA